MRVMNKEEHARWNEEMARRHNPDTFITKTGFVIRWIESQRLNCIARAIGPQENGSVLDLGCGAGNLLERLRAQRLVGLDLSDFLLSIAKRKVSGKPHVELIQGRAEELPFADATFDAVT